MSGRQWVRRYTARHDHPQVQRAGFWGQLVFDELIAISGQFGFEGFVPDEYLDPTFIARRLMWDGDPACVTAGVTAAVTAGLLTREEDGVTIDGWSRRQPRMALTPAEKQRNYRERLKAKKLAAMGAASVTDVGNALLISISSPSSSEVFSGSLQEIASTSVVETSDVGRREDQESSSPHQVALGLGPVGLVTPPAPSRPWTPRSRPSASPAAVQVLTEAELRFAAKLAALRSELCGGMPLSLQGHETELRGFMLAHAGDPEWGCQTLRNWVERDPKYAMGLNPRGRLEVFLLQSQWPRFQDPKVQEEPGATVEGPAGEAWAGALRELELDGKSYAVQQLRQIRPLELIGADLVLETRDPFIASWVTTNYDEVLRAALAKTTGREIRMDLRPSKGRAAG